MERFTEQRNPALPLEYLQCAYMLGRREQKEQGSKEEEEPMRAERA